MQTNLYSESYEKFMKTCVQTRYTALTECYNSCNFFTLQSTINIYSHISYIFTTYPLFVYRTHFATFLIVLISPTHPHTWSLKALNRKLKPHLIYTARMYVSITSSLWSAFCSCDEAFFIGVAPAFLIKRREGGENALYWNVQNPFVD